VFWNGTVPAWSEGRVTHEPDEGGVPDVLPLLSTRVPVLIVKFALAEVANVPKPRTARPTARAVAERRDRRADLVFVILIASSPL
jgi:hypothetical protein